MLDVNNSDNNDGGGDASKKNKKNSRNNKKRPAQLQPGDPDYKSPTQLRNARKRRKKKDDKTTGNTGNGNNNISKDPSLKYLSNPKAAPTVRNAIKFFRDKTNAEAGTNHDAYFPVTIGPKIGWRTVARLAVQRSSSSKNNKKLRIGLFVPGSHELLPVPDCPVHHRQINGLVKVLEDECNALNVPAFDDVAAAAKVTAIATEDDNNDDDDNKNNFGLRYVAIAVERSTQRQQLVLVWKEPPNETKNKVLDGLIRRLVILSKDKNNKEQQNIRLHSIWVHYNNAWKHANSIFDRAGRWETRFVDGDDDDNNNDNDNDNATSKDDPLYGSIREVMLPITKNSKTDSSCPIHVPLYFPPQVFRQANLDGFANIIVKIREWLHEQQQQVATVSSSSWNNRVNEDDDDNDDDNNAAEPKRKRRRGKRDTSNTSSHQQHQKIMATSTNMATLGHCLELYGGVGTIGLNLADLFDSIESSDENPFNEICFNAAADNTTIDGGEPLSLNPSKRKMITYTSKSASDIVVDDYSSLQKARVVIVDPPRKGLDPPVIEALCSDYNYDNNHNNEQQGLIYVSCGFDAFRRDYRALVEHSGKWTLDRAEGHVLFPGSDAIETLAFFTRKK